MAEGRRSDYSLYSYKLATYTNEDEFSHTAAAGFIELWGLPIEMWARVGKEHRPRGDRAERAPGAPGVSVCAGRRA